MIRSMVLLAALCLAFTLGWWARGAMTAAPANALGATPVSAPVIAPDLVSEPRLARFEAALSAQDHDRALRIYEGIADAGREPALTAQLRARIFEPVRALRSDAAALATAIDFLEAFAWLYPRDEAALTALAQAQERTGRLREALDTWWRLADAAGGGPGRARALQRARLLVDGLTDGARTRGDETAVVAILRDALQHDAQAWGLFVQLASALDDAGDHRGALDALDEIPPGVLDDARLERMRARIDESARLAAAFPEGLPLQRRGEHFIVEVGLDDGGTLDLLLDTGATLTVLRPAVVGRVPGGRSAGRSIRLGTAGGVVSAPLYSVDALYLGPLRIADARIAVMALDGMDDIDGLLGMDQLSRFDYRIDPARERLLLAHKRE
ncbi:MAG: aspartyl protease family protein [Pseudomonadales bacterium]|nr:aspartyl protease family protein [Pseudomonadales bacterium]